MAFDIGKIIDIGATVTKALAEQAKKPTNDMKPADVAKVSPAVTKAVETEVATQVNSIVENQTNSEPVWKSRILRGAVVGLLGLAATVLKDYNDDGTIPLNDLYGYATTAFGFVYVIYGRLTGAGTPSI